MSKSWMQNSRQEHRSKPPLRWLANISGNIACKALLRASNLDEDNNWNKRYDFYIKTYDFFMPLYNKYGTWYTIDLTWDFQDFETGDAFRVINENK